MAEIRGSVARDPRRSEGEPPPNQTWWEIVLQRTPSSVQLLQRIGEALGFAVSPTVLEFDNRVIAWIEAPWSDLEVLTLTAVPVHEIRQPSRVSMRSSGCPKFSRTTMSRNLSPWLRSKCG